MFNSIKNVLFKKKESEFEILLDKLMSVESLEDYRKTVTEIRQAKTDCLVSESDFKTLELSCITLYKALKEEEFIKTNS